MKTLSALLLSLSAFLFAGDTIRPGLEPLENQYTIPESTERDLIYSLKAPFLAGLDIEPALQKWFDGRLLDSKGKTEDAIKAWQEGLQLLQETSKPLTLPTWKPVPDTSLKCLTTLSLHSYSDIVADVVEWKAGKTVQYGLVIRPAQLKQEEKRPVILYCHGAAFGIPTHFIGWLARLARRGYIIACPAMRGEPLFQNDFPINGKILKCSGEIENLDGETDDCLTLLSGVWKLPYAQPDAFAMVGHSFGAGVGLMTAIRSGSKCKAIVAYDAWLVNPQRYYWDRMSRGANNWLSWADFCNTTVSSQLNGLIKRSTVHNAEKLPDNMLFFVGGAYEGSVFHKSYDDLFARLKLLKKPYAYHVMPDGGHNFVLYEDSKPARDALKIQTDFLDKYYPPLKSADKPENPVQPAP